jgi:hypothetical protein
MIVRFACPTCERAGRLDPHQDRAWECSACDHRLQPSASENADGSLTACAICGNAELYKKKGFPHWLGMTILAVACLAFLVLNLIYQQWWGLLVLLGSAVVDGLLYLWVPDVVVCYRCGAHHSGLRSTEGFQPFELVSGERYRQARIRREQRRSGTEASH